jgi:hydrogenase nickel incorporation protein HypB
MAMCDACGCGDTRIVPVELHERLLADNDRTADHNRAHLHGHGIVSINLMGSPGAGKTALLEATAHAFGGSERMAAITGDLETERDADRVRAAGIRARAITTGSACHLDAEMVHHALHHDIAHDADYLFIENVGNLVCPAIYDLGQDANVVALSVTEGEDKPLKYPVMFRNADLVLLTKVDLLPALPDFDHSALEKALAQVMPLPRMIAVSARTGEGIGEWMRWMKGLRAAQPSRSAGAAMAS